MLHSSVVASAAQAALAAIMALLIQRAATTHAARCLGAVFALFAAYSATIGAGYTAKPSSAPLATTLFVMCLVFAFASSLAFTAFLSARFSGARMSRTKLALAMVPPVAGASVVLREVLAGGSGMGPYAVLTLVVLAIQISNLGWMVSLRSRLDARGRKALSRYAIVLLVPFVPMVLDVVGMWIAPVPGYRLIRSLTTMAFLYALLAAFLNDDVQVVSLRARALGGTLTLMLGTVVVTGELVAGQKGTREAHEAVIALLALAGVMVFAVPVLVNLLYRRSFIGPLERLVEHVSVADGGRFDAIVIEHRDEIGLLAESFNVTMSRLMATRDELETKLRELARRNEQVEELNDELRWQLESRSKDLANMTAVESTDQDCRPGDVLGGRYRVVGLLGRGGMGAVHRVVRLRDEKHFALKIINQVDAEAAARFAREAEVAVKLKGPHLVSVVDVGITNGRPFLVMELILDGSLEDQRPRFGDPAWALGVLAQIARGLETIHARGIIHRDLKPANVLIASVNGEQVAKISDFGIAKERVDTFAATMPNDGSGRRLTATGALMGTVNYMAPELGEPGAKATSAVDVFAFGLIGWELCSGALPFRVPPIFVCLAGAELPAPSPLTVDTEPSLAALLHRCISPVPTDRPTAAEVARVLTAQLSSRAADVAS